MRSLLCDGLLEHEMTAVAMLSPHKMVEWRVGLTIGAKKKKQSGQYYYVILDLRLEGCPARALSLSFSLVPSLGPFLPYPLPSSFFFNSLCSKMLALICLMISILQTHFSLRIMGTQ